MYHRAIAAVAASCVLFLSAPALADLKAGTTAPTFAAKASLGGNVFDFSLAEALKKGPVVLYFYPAAFTTGCTKEAHDFASHIDDYAKLNATVIGVSEDDIDKAEAVLLVVRCRSKPRRRSPTPTRNSRPSTTPCYGWSRRRSRTARPT